MFFESDLLEQLELIEHSIGFKVHVIAETIKQSDFNFSKPAQLFRYLKDNPERLISIEQKEIITRILLTYAWALFLSGQSSSIVLDYLALARLFIVDEDMLSLSNYLNSILFLSFQDYISAELFARKALDGFTIEKHAFASAAALNCLGCSLSMQDKSAEATIVLELALHTINYARGSVNRVERIIYVGELYLNLQVEDNIIHNYLSYGQDEHALELAQSRLKKFIADGVSSSMVADAREVVGKIYYKLNNYYAALAHFIEADELYVTHTHLEKLDHLNILIYIAEIYSTLNTSCWGRSFFNRAQSIKLALNLDETHIYSSRLDILSVQYLERLVLK